MPKVEKSSTERVPVPNPKIRKNRAGLWKEPDFSMWVSGWTKNNPSKMTTETEHT